MKFYQFMVFLFFFIFLFCFYGNRIYTKMTVPYVVHKTVINKEDTDMVIHENFEGKDDRLIVDKDFPVPINKDDKKELLEHELLFIQKKSEEACLADVMIIQIPRVFSDLFNFYYYNKVII